MSIHGFRPNKLTPAGAVYAEQVLNPYRNFEADPVGKPDTNTGRSLVYAINDQHSVTIPAGGGDLHVYTMPELCNVDVCAATREGEFLSPVALDRAAPYPTSVNPVSGVSEAFSFGLFNIAVVQTGDPGFPLQTPAGAWDQNGHEWWRSNYSQYCNGRARVVGAAFKVTNTSAATTKSGQSISYRVSQMKQTATIRTYSSAITGGLYVDKEMDSFRLPPRTAQEALAIPDVVTLPSEEGNYCVVPVHGDDEPSMCSYRPAIYVMTDVPNTAGPVLVSVVSGAGNPAGVPKISDTTLDLNCRRPVSCDTVGTIHQGAQAGSTFTISMRVFIEVFPGPTSSNYPLSTRSPAEDALALAAVSHAFSELPVAVPASFNHLDVWQKYVLQALGAIAPMVGALAGPEGALMGHAANAVINGYLSSKGRMHPAQAKIVPQKSAAERIATQKLVPAVQTLPPSQVVPNNSANRRAISKALKGKDKKVSRNNALSKLAQGKYTVRNWPFGGKPDLRSTDGSWSAMS
jgi:hypothetical protein